MPAAVAHRRRTLLALVLACSLTLALVTLVASAQASIYGGLGRVGAASIKPGEAKGQILPTSNHGFVADPTTGDFYVADEAGGKDRIQAFNPKGEVIAEASTSIIGQLVPTLGGLAIDPANHRVYMLIDGVRNEEGETPIFNPGLPVAASIQSWSIESGKVLTERKQVASFTLLNAESEEPKAPVLFPTGISVDPTTHDLVLLGQQNESTTPGSVEEEDLRTIVQRIHVNTNQEGSLGPRYVDRANCIDEGLPSVSEPLCVENRRTEIPRSPVVTQGGTVLIENTQTAGQIWEYPATAEKGESFKEIAIVPKRVFSLDEGGQEGQKLVEFAGGANIEEPQNQASLIPGSGGEGHIFVDSSLEGPNQIALLKLHYAEHPSGVEVTEDGWTAGQNSTSHQEDCAVPNSNHVPVITATQSEKALVLVAQPEFVETGQAAYADVFSFGPSGEACGHVTLSQPEVAYKENRHATEVPATEATTEYSTLTGANAKSTTWSFVKGLVEEGPFTTGYGFETPSLEHAFGSIGQFTIHEHVMTDNLGTPEVSAEGGVKVTAGPIGLKLTGSPPSIEVGSAAKLEATVTDKNSSTPHLTYAWNFGDGKTATEEEAATKSVVTRKIEHAFGSTCGGKCVVKLTVTDSEGGKSTVGIFSVAVTEPTPPCTTCTTTTATTNTPPPPPPGGEVHGEKREGNPSVHIASTSLTVAANGSVTLTLSCPAGETECSGTATLKTLTAVAAKAKKSILALGTASFTLVGGHPKAVTVHLSSKARKLLAKNHLLKASVTCVAHDPEKVSKTTVTTVTLRAAKKKH